MKKFLQRGFTLLELLIVVGIMGLLGTVSVSGFRGLRQGMEERATLQVVDEFVRSAYRRAVIDRVPVHIYFWNETISDEDSDASAKKKLVVVGHAVAVRRAGRISAKDAQFLYDEFGDLADEVVRDEQGEEIIGDTSYQEDPGRYLYRMKTDRFERSVVSTMTVRKQSSIKEYMLSRPDKMVHIPGFGYYVKPNGAGEKVIGIGSWKVGDPYGFAIADLTLPKNYIFGSSKDYSDKITDPERAVNDVIVITGSGQMPSSKRISICGLKLAKNGEVAYKEIGKSEDPAEKR